MVTFYSFIGTSTQARNKHSGFDTIPTMSYFCLKIWGSHEVFAGRYGRVFDGALLVF